jgi:peptidoglycan/LPS O-acetylase OafA/YrhL
MSQIGRQRDVSLDGLRVIGLLAIILAHVANLPTLLFQVRNFDVPLMVLVSGAVYGMFGTKKKYLSYIFSRVGRLLIPTWVFLSIFFLFSLVIGSPFSKETILSSYALLDGIGYVWIIRVFILVAIIAPFFLYLFKKFHNKNMYLFLVSVIYLFYHIMRSGFITFPLFHAVYFLDFFLQNIFFYILPFGCVAGLGIYLAKATKKSLVVLFLGFTLLFLYLAYSNHFIPTQAYKYPPDIYYLSYALAVSVLLYILSKTNIFQKIFSKNIMLFIASSSLWIYLWQIFFLFQWKSLEKNLPFQNYFSEYIVIIFFSILFTYLQKCIVKKVVKIVHNDRVKSALVVSFLQ